MDSIGPTPSRPAGAAARSAFAETVVPEPAASDAKAATTADVWAGSAGRAPDTAPSSAAASASVFEGSAAASASIFEGSAAASASVFEGSPAPVAAVATVVDAGEAAEKERLLREMIRQSPSEEATRRALDSLAPMPLKAVQIVHDYGTRIELYDFAGGDHVPEYLPTLAYENTLAAYNTKANVLGVDHHKASKFTLLHEFTHALDGALGDLSNRPEWKGAWKLATTTNRTVRDYAKQDPAEYMAESTTAWLIPDEELPDLIDQGLAAGALGLEEREYLQMNQYFSRGRLERHDPDGFAMVDGLMTRSIHEETARPALPAMTEEEWHTFLESRKQAQAKSQQA